MSTFTQAALTRKLGGLALRKSIQHAGFAYSASWHEARIQSREDWSRPAQVSEVHVEQSAASFAFDESMHKYLLDSAPDDGESNAYFGSSVLMQVPLSLPLRRTRMVRIVSFIRVSTASPSPTVWVFQC